MPVDIGMRVAPKKAPGFAGASAAHALGLTTQIPIRPEIAVVGSRPASYSGALFRMRSNAARDRLNPLEIAVLEIARDRFAHVEVDHSEIKPRLVRLSDDGRIDLGKICEVSMGETLAVRAFVRDLARA